jgi:hypothetical protein
LEQAAQQLARRRKQAEDNLALEFIRRFQMELGEMVERQQQIVAETIEFEASRRPDVSLQDDVLKRIAKLANEERGLAMLASEHSEMLHGLGAVRVSLDDARQRLLDAANFLGANETGARAQRAEQLALARLKGMLDAFAQTASEAASNNGQQPADQAAQPGEQPQRRPTFELLEVKMLRMLQADLNDRTQQFKANVESLAESASENERAELRREAQQLQADQSQLSELVEEMLNRDNVEEAQ